MGNDDGRWIRSSARVDRIEFELLGLGVGLAFAALISQDCRGSSNGGRRSDPIVGLRARASTSVGRLRNAEILLGAIADRALGRASRGAADEVGVKGLVQVSAWIFRAADARGAPTVGAALAIRAAARLFATAIGPGADRLFTGRCTGS